MSITTNGIFQFGEFQIEARARTLKRKKTIIALNSRAFDVLLYFVQNPGKVLSRDELLRNVWRDACVDENNLAQSISAVRRALAEKPGENSYIVTLPGRGYQFVAPVTVIASDFIDGKSADTHPDLATAINDPSTGLIIQQETVREHVVRIEEKQLSSPIPRSRVARIASLTIAGILVLLAAAFGAARFWRSHQPPKLTERDTLLVADFENRTGDPVFDDTLKQALAVDLDQSPFLNVVSDRKISEALKFMGRDPAQRLTGEVALDLCQRVSSSALLQGSIASLAKQYVVVLRVTNCATGDSLASEKVRAESKEKILPALDKAASSLRKKLGETLGSIEKYNAPVEQASTPSLAALQAYSAGVTVWASKGNEAAIPFYRRAIELDPNFAMAYAHLGQAYANLGVPGASENIAKALGCATNLASERGFTLTRVTTMSLWETKKR